MIRLRIASNNRKISFYKNHAHAIVGVIRFKGHIMRRVKVLAEEVANRIAAGEVIERPASVVKELVENALDSGAGAITVNVERGGKSLIEVIDNGCGMNEDDALTALERHATSKIRTVSDIFEISTLGFRGEAMPSIASVSRMTLLTRDEESELATKIEIDSGVIRGVEKAAANQGTTVTVRKLFANIPARKKFLKSDDVEYRHIQNYIHYQAVLFPGVHFKLVANGRTKLNYPAVETREKRLLAVFGSDFKKLDMVEIEAEGGNMKLEGYIKGLDEVPEGLHDYRYMFVNGRFIRDKIILHALKAAYEPYVQKLRLFQGSSVPPYILFMEMDPTLIDFNVHPAKLEIRFRDAGSVHGFIKNAIGKRLMKYEDERFKSVRERIEQGHERKEIKPVDVKIYRQRTEPRRFSQVKDEFGSLYQPDIFIPVEQQIQPESQAPADIPQETQRVKLRAEEDMINPWQLHQTYILVQVEEGLMMIDQHAAHERILYEKLLHRIHGMPAPTQKLLFPLVVDIPTHLYDVVQDLVEANMETINKVGFTIKSFSGNSIVIDEIPAELEDWDGGEVFIDILRQLRDEFSETEDFRDSLAKSVACKAAIKANRKMGRKEMVALISDLFSCDVPYFCPHGRPLIIKMTLTELEKKFKRIES